jgi:hypothetical protein
MKKQEWKYTKKTKTVAKVPQGEKVLFDAAMKQLSQVRYERGK